MKSKSDAVTVMNTSLELLVWSKVIDVELASTSLIIGALSFCCFTTTSIVSVAEFPYISVTVAENLSVSPLAPNLSRIFY